MTRRLSERRKEIKIAKQYGGGGAGLDGTADETITGNWTINNAAGLKFIKDGDTEVMDMYMGNSTLKYDYENVVNVINSGITGSYYFRGGDMWLQAYDGGVTTLFIGNGVAQGNNSNDAKIVMYGEHNNTTYGMQFSVASGNFGMIGTASGCDAACVTVQFATNFQMTGAADFSMLGGNFWMRDGGYFRVGDAGDTDWAEMTHDGVDFNTDFTNTTEWNVNDVPLHLGQGSLYLSEKSSAGADTAGRGQLYVKNTTPCELWFRDDAGTETQIA